MKQSAMSSDRSRSANFDGYSPASPSYGFRKPASFRPLPLALPPNLASYSALPFSLEIDGKIVGVRNAPVFPDVVSSIPVPLGGKPRKKKRMRAHHKTRKNASSKNVSEESAATDESAQQESIGLPPHWSEVADPETGNSYYYNSETEETTWDRPAAPAGAPEQQAGAEEKTADAEAASREGPAESSNRAKGKKKSATKGTKKEANLGAVKREAKKDASIPAGSALAAKREFVLLLHLRKHFLTFVRLYFQGHWGLQPSVIFRRMFGRASKTRIRAGSPTWKKKSLRRMTKRNACAESGN